MAVWLSWVCSISGAIMLYFMGRKSRWGPRIGLASQFAWFAYAAALGPEGMGLLPGAAMYTVIHIVNIYKWEQEG